ncbi:MAG TPA: GNAT family N-acetyltransferase [Kofleriaceae bacterium]|nr:GNAT family N-acetyltransferase [Kofleriaceae bacterium]
MEVIRAAAVDDDLVAAFARLMPLLNDAPPPGRDELAEIIRTGHLYVARDPSIVGVLTLTLYRIPTGLSARIDDVIVATDSRGRGIGEALTRAAIEHARTAGARGVNLTSHPRREAANRLYQRLGFERRETNTYVYKLR